MSDFSYPTLYILGSSNTLPTTGTSANLTAGQLGVYRPDWTTASVSNLGTTAYIRLAQGRIQAVPGVDTKKSPAIYPGNVLEWYKVTAHTTAGIQQTTISTWTPECDQDVTVSVRLMSNYIKTSYFNGLTHSWTINSGCCSCGANSCATIDGTSLQNLIDQFVVTINNDTRTNSFIFAERTGSSSSSALVLLGIPLTVDGVYCDVAANPFWFDRMDFWTWIYAGPETTQDYNVYDLCDPLGTVTINQRATYPRGSYYEMLQLEKNLNSYNEAPLAKELFRMSIFNNSFPDAELNPGATYLSSSTWYDMYYLKCKYAPQFHNNAWSANLQTDFEVIIVNPTGTNSGTIAVLAQFLGNPTDDSGPTSTFTTLTTLTQTTSTSTVTEP